MGTTLASLVDMWYPQIELDGWGSKESWLERNRLIFPSRLFLGKGATAKKAEQQQGTSLGTNYGFMLPLKERQYRLEEEKEGGNDAMTTTSKVVQHIFALGTGTSFGTYSRRKASGPNAETVQ